MMGIKSNLLLMVFLILIRPPDGVRLVIWYLESNGIPGLQTNFPGGDRGVGSDADVLTVGKPR